MTRKQEVLVNYRETVITIRLMEKEIEQLTNAGYIGGPRPVRSPKLTGMPPGTNDPEAAIMQTVDYESDLIRKIREKQAVQYETMQEARDLVDTIEDKMLRNIVYAYYILGWTDMQIALDREGDMDELSRQTVQKKRSDFFNSLA